jgi:hypothetical protein
VVQGSQFGWRLVLLDSRIGSRQASGGYSWKWDDLAAIEGQTNHHEHRATYNCGHDGSLVVQSNQPTQIAAVEIEKRTGATFRETRQATGKD